MKQIEFNRNILLNLLFMMFRFCKLLIVLKRISASRIAVDEKDENV